MQRQRVGVTPDVAGDHRHCPEFTHGARIAEQYAVQQTPADAGQCDVPEALPAIGAEKDGSLFFVLALGLHQRDQFARHERKGDKHGSQHNAGNSENDLDVVFVQPGTKPALGAKHQHIDQSGNHR